MDTESNEAYEDGNRSRLLVVALLLLIGSPGSLLLFTLPLEVTPILLLLVIPITLAFVFWYRRILLHRERFRQDTLQF
ncbi:MAG: hypothetical protein ACFFED_05375 [Candidatus Thorarchaeota archaeon]